MHRFLSSVLASLLGLFFVASAQAQAPKGRPYVSKCDILCDNLTIAIQQEPDHLVMRLEDALVINEACAGEIVTAAITAVNADPTLVDSIVKTALHVAPNRSKSILYSVSHFTPRAPVALPMEEIRRPELPPGFEAQPVEEVRRAEKPDSETPAPFEEVRKAVVPGMADEPVEEIRKAEVPNTTPAPTPNKGTTIEKKRSSSKKGARKDS